MQNNEREIESKKKREAEGKRESLISTAGKEKKKQKPVWVST